MARISRRRSDASSHSRPVALAAAAVLTLAAAVLWSSNDSAEAPSDVTQLAYFYRPPVDASLETIAGSFDRYVLTKLDEPTRDALKQRGEQGPYLQYLRFDAIMDDTGLGYTYHNQVAWRPGDWKDISSNHPDWFLLDSEGKRIPSTSRTGNRFYLMDPSSDGWRNFFLTRVAEMQQTYGWDGVFLDNVEASLSKREDHGQLPAKYPTDALYQAAIKDFLSYLDALYFTPQNRPVEANIIAARSDDSPIWSDYLTQLDGAMREGWAVGWDDSSYRSEASWERALTLAERTQAAGKNIILVSMGAKDNGTRQQFAYASYLLISNGKASFRYSDPNAYDEAWLYPNYQRNLGTPLGPRYKSGSVWKRDFTGGTVTVDPNAHTATIT